MLRVDIGVEVLDLAYVAGLAIAPGEQERVMIELVAMLVEEAGIVHEDVLAGSIAQLVDGDRVLFLDLIAVDDDAVGLSSGGREPPKAGERCGKRRQGHQSRQGHSRPTWRGRPLPLVKAPGCVTPYHDGTIPLAQASSTSMNMYVPWLDCS